MQSNDLKINVSKLKVINNHLEFLLDDMHMLEDHCERLRSQDNPQTITIIKSEIECQKSLIKFIMYISKLTRQKA